MRILVTGAARAIGRATAVLTTSRYAASLARAEARPGDAGKVRAVPFAFPVPAIGPRAPEPGLVADGLEAREGPDSG